MALAWEVMLFGLIGVFAALFVLFIAVKILVKLFPFREKKPQDLDKN